MKYNPKDIEVTITHNGISKTLKSFSTSDIPCCFSVLCNCKEMWVEDFKRDGEVYTHISLSDTFTMCKNSEDAFTLTNIDYTIKESE